MLSRRVMVKFAELKLWRGHLRLWEDVTRLVMVWKMPSQGKSLHHLRKQRARGSGGKRDGKT